MSGAPTVGPRAWQSVLSRGLRTADTVLCALLAAATGIMLLAALVQVGARYVTHMTIIGPEEIARYMMVGSAFLAIPVLGHRRNHIAVDALAHLLRSAVAKVWLHRLVLAVELAFLLLFTYLSWDMVTTSFASGQTSIGLDVPLAWPLLTVLVGAGLGSLVTAAMLVDALTPAPAEPDTDHEFENLEGAL